MRPNDRAQLLWRIVVDPEVLGGDPSIRGSRVPVSLVLNLLGHGYSFDRILAEFPYLEGADLRAALAYSEAKMTGDAPNALAR